MCDWLVQGRSAYEHSTELLDNDLPSPPKKVPTVNFREPISSRGSRRGRPGSKHVISCSGAPFIPELPLKSKESEDASKPQSTKPREEGTIKQVEIEDEESVHVVDLPAGCSVATFKSSKGEEFDIILRIPPPGCGEEGAIASTDTKNIDGPAGRLGAVLTRLRPRCVVLFEPLVAWVREVEVYAAREARRRIADDLTPDPVRVYFMVFKNSVEEQRYLTRLRRVSLSTSLL